MNGYFYVLTAIDLFVLSFMCILTKLSESLNKKQKQGFFFAFALIAVISVLEVVTLAVDGTPAGYRWLNILSNYLGFGLSPGVCLCLVYVMDRKKRMNRWFRAAVCCEACYLLFLALSIPAGLLNQNSYLNRTAEMRRRGGVLVVFDVDDFKQINDRYGHLQGDICLAEIGRCLKKAYARSGYCYRTGGDEFCVLMENADREAQCAQEFVRQLEQRRKAVDFLPTVSFGSAPFLGEDVLAVKNRADREMYRYKKARKPDAAGEMA